MEKTVFLFVLFSLVFTLPACTDTDINSDLISAARDGHTDTVKSLLDRGTYVNEKDKDGGTALMRAALNDYTEIADLLKKYGAKE